MYRGTLDKDVAAKGLKALRRLVAHGMPVDIAKMISNQFDGHLEVESILLAAGCSPAVARKASESRLWVPSLHPTKPYGLRFLGQQLEHDLYVPNPPEVDYLPDTPD